LSFNFARTLTLTALISAATLLTAQQAPQPPQPKPLSVENIYSATGILGRIPMGLRWSPDSKHLTLNKQGDLLELDLATGKPTTLVSKDKLADVSKSDINEKDKDHRARYAMADYIWSPDSSQILFDSNGQLAIYDLKSQTAHLVGQAADSGDDPQFSPNGKLVAFIRDHGLHVADLTASTIAARPLAPAPNSTTLNGEVDWVYQEELDVRTNYAWSPDSAAIAFLQMDEAKVPTYPLTDWIPFHPEIDNQRYPQVADPNPAVRIGVVTLAGTTTWLSLPIIPNQDYIPRFGWLNAKTLWVQTLTRDHKHKSIYFADAATGKSSLALALTDDKFFDESYDMHFDSGSLITTSWQDGHNHLYRYTYDAANPTTLTLAAQLTHGDFEVESYTVDAAHSTIYFSSNEGDPISSNTWKVDIKGNRAPLTTGAGSHHINLSPDGSHYVDSFSNLTTTGTVSLCQSGGSCNQLWSRASLESAHLSAPRIITTTAHDGKTTLYSVLILPEGAKDPASVPVIVNPYGGPGPMTVTNGWSDEYLFDELLATHGFAVLHTDNRGTGHRGRDFAQAAYHNFGPVQLEDQLTALDNALTQFPVLDGKRLGWWGWSWGGTFTLYSMSHSDRFRAGVAVAPVTDFRLYDSIYTERYLGVPPDADSVAAYEAASVQNSTAKLHGHLLIAHGTGDDNVHPSNTIQYIQKLIESGKSYDLQLYPRKTHSIAGQDVRISLFNRILNQFDQYLKPTTDPNPATGNVK
jgi:dipeptidyl-peptidase-4